jgi:hypothetical protein
MQPIFIIILAICKIQCFLYPFKLEDGFMYADGLTSNPEFRDMEAENRRVLQKKEFC